MGATATFKRRTRLEQRLKTVRRELSAIRNDVRELSKYVEDPYESRKPPRTRTNIPRSLPSAAAVARASRTAMSAVLERVDGGTEEITGGSATVAEHAPDLPLFSHGKAGGTEAAARSKVDAHDGHFASLFAPRGLQRLGPMRQERSVQRSKAIFMLVVVGIAVFILWSIFWR